jgi:hypothetical protein
MSQALLETHVKEFLANKMMSAQVLVSLTGSLITQVALKDISVEDKKKTICEALETALKNNSTGLSAEEVTGLTYVIKNVVPHLVDLLGSFNLNALEKRVEKEVVAVATSYWASCLAFLPPVFRGQVAFIAAAAAPELLKKAEELAAPLVDEAVKKIEEVAGPDAAAAVSAVVEAVAAPEAVAVPEKVEVVLDAAAKVPDWSAPVDLSGAVAPSTESSNPV